MRKGLLIALVLLAILLLPQTVRAQGAAPLFDTPVNGCHDVAVYGLGMFDTGAGSVTLAPPAGPVVAAYIEWVGVEDTTPGGLTLDGTSTLTVNGVDVDGTLAAPFDGSGNAGYDPHGYADSGPMGWFAWHADIGVTGAGIVPSVFTTPLIINVEGWDSPARQTNGASVTLVYAREGCTESHKLHFLTGVNWYYHNTPGQNASELLVYTVEPEPVDRAARMYFSHAGTDKSQTVCRGGAVWMTAGDASQPLPGPADFDLVGVGDTNGDGIPRGYGTNGGVEIIHNPFTSPSLPCAPALNPAPDEDYAAGHPYPGGAATAPYRAVAINPPTGGDVGAPGEWGVLEATVVIPANATWVAFQLESEADQSGESGSWVGGGVFLLLPPAAIGDRVWDDLNANGIQETGEPGVGNVAVTLYDSTDQPVATTLTDSDGIYGFADLVTGEYSLHFALPAGYEFTTAHVENGPQGDGGDSDADPITGRTPATHLAPGETDLTWDAGLVRLTPAIDIEKLPDFQKIAYGDDATFTIVVRNTGELDLFDVTVTDPLVPACDRVIGDLPVDGQVTYTCTAPAVLVDFTNVAAVTGRDRFEREVNDEDDAVVDVLPLINVEKTADPEVVSVDGGVVTFVVRVDNLVDEPLLLRELIDDVFGDLRGVGTCRLPVTIPVGGSYECRFNGTIEAGEENHHNTVTGHAEDDEGNPAEDDDDATVIRVAPAADSAVGDYVWVDRNANGLQDDGAAGLRGVLVTLFRRDGAKVGDTETNADGLYKFTGLEAGDYYLEFFVPNTSGQFTNFTRQDAGDDDLIDSDVGPGGLNGRTVVFTLPEDTEDLSWDAGLLVPTAGDTGDEPTPDEGERVYLPFVLNR